MVNAMTRALGNSRRIATNRFNAVHARQLEVHERNVGRMPPELFDRFFAVARLGDDRHARLEIEKARNALSQQAVIVNDQQAERGGCHGITCHQQGPSPRRPCRIPACS